MARRVLAGFLGAGALLLTLTPCGPAAGGLRSGAAAPGLEARGAFVAASRGCSPRPAPRAPRVGRRQAASPLEGGAPPDAKKQEERRRRQLQELVARHRANNAEAGVSLVSTGLLWIAAVAALHISGGHWAAITFLALNMVRCFIVFHDAAHLSFFEDAESNRVLARILQFFVNYSYKEWDSVHNSHHAHFGDVTVKDASLTVFFSQAELDQASWPLRLAHRVIRDPLLFFPLAGFFVFFVNKPLQHGLYRAAMPLLLGWLLGPQTALTYVLAGWLAGSIGVAAFHLQHHCNAPYRVEHGSARSNMDAAMLGSTRIPLPFPLSVFSFGIEYHHIHHFDVRVPGYHLARCDAQGARLGLWERVNTVSAERAFKSLFHTQFEGSRKFADDDGTPPRFVSFWPYSAVGLQDA